MIARSAILFLLGGAVWAEEGPLGAPGGTGASSEGQQPSVPAKVPESRPESNGEYEIDYEEEVAQPTPPPVSAPRKSSRPKPGTAVQGSRAKDRFTPILKSETKSVYKKGGKTLDVDPD